MKKKINFNDISELCTGVKVLDRNWKKKLQNALEGGLSLTEISVYPSEISSQLRTDAKIKDGYTISDSLNTSDGNFLTITLNRHHADYFARDGLVSETKNVLEYDKPLTPYEQLVLEKVRCSVKATEIHGLFQYQIAETFNDRINDKSVRDTIGMTDAEYEEIKEGKRKIIKPLFLDGVKVANVIGSDYVASEISVIHNDKIVMSEEYNIHGERLGKYPMGDKKEKLVEFKLPITGIYGDENLNEIFNVMINDKRKFNKCSEMMYNALSYKELEDSTTARAMFYFDNEHNGLKKKEWVQDVGDAYELSFVELRNCSEKYGIESISIRGELPKNVAKMPTLTISACLHKDHCRDFGGALKELEKQGIYFKDMTVRMSTYNSFLRKYLYQQEVKNIAVETKKTQKPQRLL